MENASKALLIAGGVLLAMLILSLMVYVFTGMSDMMDAQDTKKLNEQIQAFNAEYEAYNKTILYGADIISICNKIVDNNKKYSDNREYQITLVVIGRIPNEETNRQLISSDINSMRDNYQFKTSIFKCTNISYSETTGRVNKIEFEMKNLNKAER